MRLNFLLVVLIFLSSFLKAQDEIDYTKDTIDYLLVTEARLYDTGRAYLELTNVGEKPIDLDYFKIGIWGGGTTLSPDGHVSKGAYWIPKSVVRVLEPGESFLMATVNEWGPEQFKLGRRNVSERTNPPNMLEKADAQIHLFESGNVGGSPTDSVTPGIEDVFSGQWRANGFYVMQKFPGAEEGTYADSVVVDQIGGMFNGEDGKNPDRTNQGPIDVAGWPSAHATGILVRKFKVKEGQLDYFNNRGAAISEGEWIVIPQHGTAWRLAPWTIGNHGNYQLDENTLVSDIADVDFANRTITVPWGVRRADYFMSIFEEKPGIAWDYVWTGTTEDSLSYAANTGDRLILYVCGNEVTIDSFEIVVQEPSADVKTLITKFNEEGSWQGAIENGNISWPRVTYYDDVMDTIWGPRGGIPYGTRIDSLYDRLDWPSNASLSVVPASGIDRPDLYNGDIVKVTAEDGSEKEYYVSVSPYRKNDNTSLSSITWPDIPEFYKGIYGWKGDTIPTFSSGVWNYNTEVPLMAQGIPALTYSKQDINASVEVKRASSLTGTQEARTTRFHIIAEDDTTTKDYNVVLSKEINPESVQPYYAKPFISEYLFHMQWSNNNFMEICNPGNQPLDLSDYMFINTWTSDWVGAVEEGKGFGDRYRKYIPGFKWASDEANWEAQNYLAEKDLAVNPIVPGGDVFVMGRQSGGGVVCDGADQGYVYPGFSEVDVQFTGLWETDCGTFTNTWGEESAGSPFGAWFATTVYMLEITNDSVKQGLKPANDPNDFELIDMIGGGGLWQQGDPEAGVPTQKFGNPFSIIRKPEVFIGRSERWGSLGATIEESEFLIRNSGYFNSIGEGGWPWNMLNIARDIGKHFFIPPTHYMSTISSAVYLVSEGYTMDEEIRGIKDGTKVSEFLDNVDKKNEGQSLSVLSGGAEKGDAEVVANGDILNVLSADSVNTSQYVIEVTAEGLSTDALLTSTQYEINVTTQADGETMGEGEVTGFAPGTTLKEVKNQVTVPFGAKLTIVDSKDAYVPLVRLNLDTAYVDVVANNDVYFEVIAEDSKHAILYRLMPAQTESDAYITSNVFDVDEALNLIKFVPQGVNVEALLASLIPSEGAALRVEDSAGELRPDGTIADDDVVIVTSADGTVENTYYISKLSNTSNFTLAYLVSNAYAVNQADKTVSEVKVYTHVDLFLQSVTLAPGASAVILDADGAERTEGRVADTDIVRVTSGDGNLVVDYSISFTVSKETSQLADNILVYPNPTAGGLNVIGVEEGQRIRVSNIYGSTIRDLKVTGSHQHISLDDQPAGMYLIVVSSDAQVLGKYKTIKY